MKHKDRRANIPTEELRDFVAEDEAKPEDACSTRATRRSTRSSSGRARTSRTSTTLAVPVVPVYIQEKIHPQAIIENLRDTGQGAASPSRSSTSSPTSTASSSRS